MSCCPTAPAGLPAGRPTPRFKAGIAGASWSISGTFARGLCRATPCSRPSRPASSRPRTTSSMATAWATLQALGAIPGQRPGPRANLVAGAGIVGGMTMSAIANPLAGESFTAAAVATAGRITSSAAGGASVAWDGLLHRQLGLKPGFDTTLLPSVATGAAVVAFSMISRSRRAAKYGIVAPDRHAVAGVGVPTALKAGAVGLVSGPASPPRPPGSRSPPTRSRRASTRRSAPSPVRWAPCWPTASSSAVWGWPARPRSTR